MQKVFYSVRKYPFSSVLILGIWIICLIPIPETPLDNVQFIDKYTHILFYVSLVSVIAAEYFYKNKKQINRRHFFIGDFLLPMFMGGLIELVQRYCTFGIRSGEWLDFLADSVGVTIAFLFAWITLLVLDKRYGCDK